jgi:hypothetical protein
MGLWTTIKLLGAAPKVIDTGLGLVKDISSGIDHLKFTEEEQSENNKEIFNQVIEFVKLNRDENSQRSITRRRLAVMLVRYFLVMMTVYLLSLEFRPLLSPKIFLALKMYFSLVAGVCFFYFGYYGVKSIVQSLGKKG